MSAAIDFGSYRLRSLSRQSEVLAARSFRSIYTTLDDTPEQRGILDRVGIPYAVCDNTLTIIGDYAEELGSIATTPSVPLILDGRIPSDDPPARQILNILVEAILPSPTGAENICTLIVPGTIQNDSNGLEFVRKLVRLRGYETIETSPGRALILAEGNSEQFSGIGISFGASACDLSLVIQGVEIGRRVVPHGGSWIDQQLASQDGRHQFDRNGECYLDLQSIAQWKETRFRSLKRRDTVLEHALCNLYTELLHAVAVEFETLINRHASEVAALHRLPIFVCGGTSQVDGFPEALRHALRSCNLPSAIGEINSTSDAFAICRGGVINTELSVEAREKSAA